MPKLGSQRKYKHSMEYCKECKEWVPDLERHNKKRHKILKKIGRRR